MPQRGQVHEGLADVVQPGRHAPGTQLLQRPEQILRRLGRCREAQGRDQDLPVRDAEPRTGCGAAPGLLHDGRARSVLEAILWHGGEAQPARDRVLGLAAGTRAALLAFLDSL